MSKVKEVREFLLKEGFTSDDKREYRSKDLSISLESNQIFYFDMCLFGLDIKHFSYDKLDRFYKVIKNRETYHNDFAKTTQEAFLQNVRSQFDEMIRTFSKPSH